MKRVLTFLALLCALLVIPSARAQTPGYTLNSFDGQYIYYNTNSGQVVREPVFPFFSVGAPQGVCQIGAIDINTTDQSHYYCNSSGSWVKFAQGAGGSGCVPSGTTPAGVLYDTGSGTCDDADKLVWDPANHRLLEGTSTGLNSNVDIQSFSDGIFCGRIVANNHNCLGSVAQNNSGPAVATTSYAKSTGSNAGATGLDANAYEEPAMGQTVGSGFAGAGVFSSHQNLGAGTVVNSAAFRGFSLNQGTGVITNQMSMWAEANGNIGGGTVTKSYGLYGDAQSSGASNYQVYLVDEGTGANDYSLYSAGGKVQIVGAIRFGGTSNYYTFGGTPSGVRTITAPDADTVIPVGITATSTQFLTGLNASTGVFTRAQPAYSDISGTPTLFYQTIQNSSGTPVTQAATVKFTGTAVTSTATAAGVTTVTLTAGAGGSGCVPPGATGDILTDDGMGGCTTELSKVPVTLGGTNLATLTAHALYVGNGTSTPVAIGLGTAGQPLISNGVGADPTYQDPIVSYNYVNLLSAAVATAQATGSATRVSTFSQYGTLFFTFASITGSPAGCTVQVKSYDSLGNSLANGSAISVSPSNGVTSTTFTPAANLFTAGQMSATFACSGAYPSTGTVSVDFLPGITVFSTLSSPLPAGTNVIGHVIADTGSTTAVTGNVTVVQATGTNLHSVIDSGSTTAVTGNVTVVQGTGTNLHVDIDTSLPAGANVIGHIVADSGSTTVITGNVTVVQGTGTNLHVDVDTALPAGTNVIGHTIADTGSTTAVTGNVTVVQGTGTNLHAVLDTTSTTAVTQATAANLNDTAAQGAAAAATAGWPSINGVVARASASWTSATSNNTALTATTTGYGSALVTTNTTSTITQGTLNFEGSDDAGTTWFPAACNDVNTFVSATTYVLVATTLQAFECDIAGFNSFRVRLSPVITGSGTDVVALTGIAGVSEPNATVGQATASLLNATVVGTGTFTTQAQESGTWNITNVSGTVSLPTGAATSTIQTNGTQETQIFDGTALMGTMANFGTTPGAVKALNANASCFIGTIACSNKSTTISTGTMDMNLVGVLGATMSKTNPAFVNIADGTNSLTAALSAWGSAPTGTEVEGVNSDLFIGGTIQANDGTAGFAGVGGHFADNGVAAATNRVPTLDGIYQNNYLNGTAATQGRNGATSIGTDGLLWTAILPALRPASYHASSSIAGSSTTVVSAMPGNATNTVVVTGVEVTCTQTTAGVLTWTLNKTSAAATGGTSATMTKVPDDSGYSAASSAPLTYTSTGPTAGTPVGQIDAQKVGCNAAATAGPNDVYVLDFSKKPIVLRGTAQTLEIGAGGAITGGNVTVTWKWLETTTITP